MAAVTGSCPGVGLSGYSLGGGWGALSASRGLGVDNVLSYRAVLADGRAVEAERGGPHADLFWALLGGGHNNYGVVTSMAYKIFPLAQIATFNASWDVARDPQRAARVLHAWQEAYLDKAPRALSTWPHVYADARTGAQLVAIYATHAPVGTPTAAAEKELREAMQPLLALGPTSHAFELRPWRDMPNQVVRRLPAGAATSSGGGRCQQRARRLAPPRASKPSATAPRSSAPPPPARVRPPAGRHRRPRGPRRRARAAVVGQALRVRRAAAHAARLRGPRRRFHVHARLPARVRRACRNLHRV